MVKLKNTDEIKIIRVIFLFPDNFVYRGIAPAITIAMATYIRGRYVFSNRVRKNASLADPAVIPMAEKQKK